MARVVREIMNPELFSVTTTSRRADTLDAILQYGITAVPVLDTEHRPVGVTSIRDLVRGDEELHVASPALSVALDASIDDAARRMAESGVHHLVVVGGDGRAVGMVSSLDLLRALIGFPAKHPATFPHYDAELGVAFGDMVLFDAEHINEAPEGPGILVLSIGGVGRTECDVWVESSMMLRARLDEMLRPPPESAPELARLLERRDLRFRCVEVADRQLCESMARRLRARIESVELPRDLPLVEESPTTARW